MKNSFARLVFAAVLSTAAGTAFASSNPTFGNSRGANQKNCQFNGNKNNAIIRQNSESFDNEYPEDQINDYGKLEVLVPNVELMLFNETYSVGGYGVCLRVQLVSDDYFPKKNENGDDIYILGGWYSKDSVIKIRESDYAEIKRNGSSATFKTKEDLWKTLRHEAVHAAFSQKYPLLESKNPSLNSFVTEMLAYVGGTGLDEREAATHISKKYPLAKVFADKYLVEFDKKQCEKEMKVLLPPWVKNKSDAKHNTNVKDIAEKMEDSKSDPPKPRWQCDSCGTVFETGEDLAGHLLGDCASSFKKK